MKRLLHTAVLILTFSFVSFAQEDDDDGVGKLKEKLVEYIQTKLSLSKAEAEKFQPIFFDYLKQLRSTKQEFKGDKLVLQQKIADLRLRTRDQLKPILGDKRSNDVFIHEGEFLKKVRDALQDRRGGRANKRLAQLQ